MLIANARVLGSCLPALAMTLGACEPASAPNDQGSATVVGPIVNGVLESGWNGVGALTLTYPVGGYAGAFCSGALIAPRWVLTAAHCLVDNDYITPPNVAFMVGTNANRDVDGEPVAGTLIASDAFLLNPDFDPASYANDIALVHLAADAPGGASYPFNTSFLSDVVGQGALYVGFGAVEGLADSGVGIKRSATIAVSWVYDAVITADFVSAGPCHGDSGAPVFMELDGAWRVIGVHSAAVGCDPDTDPSCDPDPCRNRSVETRVDVHAIWLSEVIAAPLPSCAAQPARCACAGACLANGVCDNDVCRVADCETTYECLEACADATCQSGCYAAATDAARAGLDALMTCGEARCGGAADFSSCLDQQCAGEVAACFPVGTGPASCRQVYDCLVACPAGDGECANRCHETGTSVAQAQYDALAGCFGDRCGSLDGDAFQTCVTAECGGEIATCLPIRTGAESCEAVTVCMDGCADDACLFACYEGGTAAAQLAYDALVGCAEGACGALVGAAYGECVLMQCRAPYDACFPPANCAVTGGDCPDQEACFPLDEASTDCFASNDKVVGAACDVAAAALDCGDGAMCVERDQVATCTRLCRLDVDCGPGASCEPLSDTVTSVGACASDAVDPVEVVEVGPEVVEAGPEVVEAGPEVVEAAEAGPEVSGEVEVSAEVEVDSEVVAPEVVAEVSEPEVDGGPEVGPEVSEPEPDVGSDDLTEADTVADAPDAGPDDVVATDTRPDDVSAPDTATTDTGPGDAVGPDTSLPDTIVDVTVDSSASDTTPTRSSSGGGCAGGGLASGPFALFALVAAALGRRRARQPRDVRACAASTGRGGCPCR